MDAIPANDHDVLPLPARMRRLLLELLTLGHAPHDTRANLGCAPDATVVRQVQSMLDVYADHRARARFVSSSNDDTDITQASAANDNVARVA
jgi:hypothetical protein